MIVRFNSETERLKNKLVAPIPLKVWQDYFNNQITVDEYAMLNYPIVKLINKISTLSAMCSKTKFLTCLACAYRDPMPSDETLYEIAILIKLPHYELLLITAITGRLNFFEKAYEQACQQVRSAINDQNYMPFRSAAGNGHLNIMKKFLELLPNEKRNMIMASNYDAFRQAARGGHLHIIQILVELLPKQMPAMIEACQYEAFRWSVGNGHVLIMHKLIELLPDALPAMHEAEEYAAVRMAAANGYFYIIQQLVTLLPATFPNVMRAKDLAVFKCIASEHYIHLINPSSSENYLGLITQSLNLPDIFSYAEQHEREYIQYVRPFINHKLTVLKQRHKAQHPTIVSTQQEATTCFYILRHMIRQTPTSPSLLANIDFLMQIQIVQSLLHQPISGVSHKNELLRLAMRLGKHDIIERLLSISAVREQAERDNFYPTEARGQIDIRAIAQNRESSMQTLSIQEQAMFKQLRQHYQPAIDSIGLNLTFSAVRKSITKRYIQSPALLIRDDDTSESLPLLWHDFHKMKLSVNESTRALQAYYQHPTHTAFRYLSKPNPWMSEYASHININSQTNERWSTFEEYIDMIVILWRAAEDKSAPATDGFTIETRIEELINEIALIGRAHNWDTTRIKKNLNGQAILSQSGHFQHEEYDDLEGDKPSCYSGVKRRLFQALKGHPFFSDNIQAVITSSLKEKLRDHMVEQFKRTSTNKLEAIMDSYIKLTQGENVDALLRDMTLPWNIPDSILQNWTDELYQRYSPLLGKSETITMLQRCTNEFFKTSLNSSHFLADLQRSQLHVLCQQEIGERENNLHNLLQKQTPEKAFDYLEENDEITGEPRLIKAIHMGLFKYISKHIGVSLFEQLLCKNEATIDYYAGVLAPYIGTDELEEGLVDLQASLKKQLLETIQINTSIIGIFTPRDGFLSFLRTMNHLPQEAHLLYKKIVLLEASSTLEALSILINDWLKNNPNSKIAPTIYKQAIATGMNVTFSHSTANLSEASQTNDTVIVYCDSTIEKPPSFDDLPNDHTSELLQEYERQERTVEVVRPSKFSILRSLPESDNTNHNRESNPRLTP